MKTFQTATPKFGVNGVTRLKREQLRVIGAVSFRASFTAERRDTTRKCRVQPVFGSIAVKRRFGPIRRARIYGALKGCLYDELPRPILPAVSFVSHFPPFQCLYRSYTSTCLRSYSYTLRPSFTQFLKFSSNASTPLTLRA